MANPFTTTTMYDQKYFSGSQVSIYIGDVLIDEITNISFTLMQNKKPIYGYASQLFDATAKGAVIVQGQFGINFKENEYLTKVLERWNTLAGSPLVVARNEGSGGIVIDDFSGELSRQTIESFIRDEQNGQSILPEQRIQFLSELSAMKDDQSSKVFSEFEGAIWGTSDAEPYASRPDSNDFDGFTIYISYGDFNTSQNVNRTARRIDGVRIGSIYQEISPTGQPITEQYQFIARNLV